MHGVPIELYLKIKGNPKYLFVLMDDQTRFWIAQQVADTKYTANIQPLFKMQKKLQEKDQIRIRLLKNVG